jgi:hypothetical protein
MKIIKNFISRSEEVKDLMKFLWKVKLWFLIPFIVILIIFGGILIFAQTTGIAPFIYSII